MSKIDNELFELCKEVYKRFPEWKDTDRVWVKETGRDWRSSNMDYRYKRRIPLYTSDYILEKLPKYFGDPLHVASYLKLEPLTDSKWAASYGNNDYDSWADTPLKALLKLVIAFNDAKQLV